MTEVKIHIRPNRNVPIAKFSPDPNIPGGHMAHPQTIKALKKEILTQRINFEDDFRPYTCKKCKEIIDLQFWNLCPFCEEKIN